MDIIRIIRLMALNCRTLFMSSGPTLNSYCIFVVHLLADFMHLQIKSYVKLLNEAFSGAECILLIQRSKPWLKVETNSCIQHSRSPLSSESDAHVFGVIGIRVETP